MTCTECGSQSENFAYCNHSMCGFPVCFICAPIHALKEAFRKLPLDDLSKNKFLNDSLEQLTNHRQIIYDIIEISKRKPKTDEEKAIIKCLKEILSENCITLHSKGEGDSKK
jgi:hypothetical protein